MMRIALLYHLYIVYCNLTTGFLTTAKQLSTMLSAHTSDVTLQVLSRVGNAHFADYASEPE